MLRYSVQTMTAPYIFLQAITVSTLFDKRKDESNPPHALQTQTPVMKRRKSFSGSTAMEPASEDSSTEECYDEEEEGKKFKKSQGI